MKVHLIKQNLEEYCSYLKSLESFEQSYLWQIMDVFVENWDIEELDFRQMFDRSFQSDQSLRLWKRENYFPKEMMLKLIDVERETLRSIFKDLLNEDKDLNLRINRFIHHIDQMLQIVQRKDMKASTHYHADLRFVFAYLAFCYPEKYTLYDGFNFSQYLVKVEARNVPKSHDPNIFKNLMKATKTIMFKDVVLMEQIEIFKKEYDLSDHLNLWVSDFYNFVATGKGRHQDL